MLTPEQACKKAIADAGGPAAVGMAIGISGQAVSQWRIVPSGRVRAVMGLPGVRLSPHDVRPDLYPPGFEFPPERAPTSEAASA